MRILFLTTVIATVLFGTSSRADCPALPGMDAVLLTPARVVIFGEPHGSVEAPALFGDAVCAALDSGLEITVALELQAAEDRFVQEYMASEGTPADRRLLLSAPYWRGARDGRTSIAMIDLIERLRRMRALGLPIKVISFQPIGRRGVPQNYYEIEMAALWARGLPEADADHGKLLILTGTVHATKVALARYDLRPAASHLPAAEVMSLRLAPEGGESWGCNRTECGPLPVPTGPITERGIVVERSADGAFDGLYAVGGPLTVSSPAVDD